MADDADRTLFVGNISRKVTDVLLYELFLQAGPLEKVNIPEDKATGEKKTFAFVVFKHAVSVPYTIKLMEGTSLFGQTLRLQTRAGSSHGTTTATQGQGHPMGPPSQVGPDVGAMRRSQSWNEGDYSQRRGGNSQPFLQQAGLLPLGAQMGMGGQVVLQGLASLPRGADPSMDPRRVRIMQQQGLMIAAHHQRGGVYPYGGTAQRDQSFPGAYAHGSRDRYQPGQGQGHYRQGRY